MPYRALTHGRVAGAQLPPANAHTNQAKAIESQRGVSNSGPVRKTSIIQCKQVCRTFLMGPNAYGQATFTAADGKVYSNYSSGEGKGFPAATPLPSVGSVNSFARRAIARRAVTKRVGVTDSKNCCINNKTDNS